MLTKHEVSVWDHLDAFSDEELRFWLKAYRDHLVPQADARRGVDPANYQRAKDMLAGLTDKAAKRGLA